MLDVLVVDDHPLVRAGLQSLLGATPGLRCTGTAADGAQALELARAQRPDVVLMDMSMPVLDGVAATRCLQALDVAPAVVALTSSCTPTLVKDVFAAGAVGYLVKDVPPAELASALLGMADGAPAIDPRAARILERVRRQAGTCRGPAVSAV